MALITLSDIAFTFGGPQLLDGVSLDVDRGERIGLVGRNGTGKSTLLKIIAGEIAPDNGNVNYDKHVTVARLVQEVPQDMRGTVADILRGALESSDDATPEEWQGRQSVERVMSRMGLDASTEFSTMSSGMKRRVLLGRALVGDPDVLLLDEPTNHLDIDAITWLEGFLKTCDTSLVFVTHDRVFLQALATRIVEIDRGSLFDWTCDYATFLKRKEAALAAEEKQNELFDRKLAEEERWIRQGIKARRTRNEGRVRALKAMRRERSERRDRIGNVKMQASEAERSGRLVIETEGLGFAYGDEPIVRDLSVLITRGEKIGIIGRNGTGKTTLLKLLLGEMQPDTGTVRHGTRLEIIYFDQLREQIDDSQTVVENVGEGQDMLDINGRKQHVYGYLQDFLFTPDRARVAVRFLSGGERNRLLLARLFKRSSNVMVLDEPTNDLDAETLELLEELVASYNGTVLLVSHDRAFLNNVVTSTLALEGDGLVHEYDGGYDDYLRQRSANATPVEEEPKPAAKKSSKPRNDKPAKLSYKLQRELDELPEQIDTLEQQQAALHARMADPEFFKQSGDEIAAATNDLKEIEEQLAVLFTRWEELEAGDATV